MVASAAAVCFSSVPDRLNTSAATMLNSLPGLITRARHTSRSPIAGEMKLSLYSAVSTRFCGCSMVAAATVVALSTRKAVTPPWKKPCCCNSSGRRHTPTVQEPGRSSSISAPMCFMNPCSATRLRISAASLSNKAGSAAKVCSAIKPSVLPVEPPKFLHALAGIDLGCKDVALRIDRHVVDHVKLSGETSRTADPRQHLVRTAGDDAQFVVDPVHHVDEALLRVG